mmetsp:Transcript_4999/g.13789  ORF Transcript_4999/g.13789 Transcript_4999/m.13789 type:complete len:389 (-) Transcript_4999:133-1299(-)
MKAGTMFRHGFRCFSRFAASVPPRTAGMSVAAMLAGQPPVPVSAEAPKRQSALSPRRILIDTDPGVDDALALLLAMGSDELQIEGLTIVFGNGKDIRVLGANAKLVARLAGLESLPVSLGATPAVDNGTEGAAKGRAGGVLVHGCDNLGNVAAKYGRCDADFSEFHALRAPEFIYQVCAQYPGEVTLVCIGPLRNLAAALESHPDLPFLVQEVVIMGGAFGARRGNRTPAAEANFIDDPEAARAVLRANFRKVVVAGLDVTHQTDTRLLCKSCSDANLPLSNFVWDVCEHYANIYRGWGETVAPAHDTAPVMYLLRPDLFDSKHVRVEVETRGEFTRGMSVADWRGQWGKEPNCIVLTSIVDKDAYSRVFVEAVARLPLNKTKCAPGA